MFSWGSNARKKELSCGRFFCPKCDIDRPYVQKKVSKMFTLDFIPLFKTTQRGEFIECLECGGWFDPKVLDPETQGMFKLVAGARYDLLHGTTPADVKARLIEIGTPEAEVNKIIIMAQS